MRRERSLSDFAQRLGELLHTADEAYTVAVIGEANEKVSSFLNGLFEEEIFPPSITAGTSARFLQDLARRKHMLRDVLSIPSMTGGSYAEFITYLDQSVQNPVQRKTSAVKGTDQAAVVVKEETGTILTVMISAEQLAIRDAPSLQVKQIDTATRDELYAVHSKQENWIEIRENEWIEVQPGDVVEGEIGSIAQ